VQLRSRLAVGIGALAVGAAGVGVAVAAFSATTTNPASTFSAKRIFSGARATPSSVLGDAADGSFADNDDAFSFAGDARTKATKAWSASFASANYETWDLTAPRPAGLSVSSIQLNLDWADNGGAGAGTLCWYVEVLRTSTSALIGTHNNGGSYYCSSSTTLQNTTIALPEVTSTDIANDLTIKLYGRESGGKAMKIDRVTVSGTDAYASFTLYEESWTDKANGTAATTAWAIASAEGTGYTTGNWAGAAAPATRYVQYTFDPGIPAGATVTSVTFTHVWHPSAAITNGGTMCNYLETFNGATSLLVHGGNTPGTAVSCDATTAWQTDSVPLAEVNTPAKANSLSIKVYGWVSPTCGGAGNPACKGLLIDQAQASFTYYLD
jgi:hypothetical protein